MHNKKAIPHYLRRQAYRWTRPQPTTAAKNTCANGRHVWVFRDDVPEQDTPCLCGLLKYREEAKR